MAQNIFRNDAAKGLTLASELKGKAQGSAYRQIVNEWMDKDSVAASEYVNKMPQGSARDSAASAVARNAVREDPTSAIVWANSIHDPEIRTESLIDVGRRYTAIIRLRPRRGWRRVA